MADASVITGSPLSPARGRINTGARFWPSTVAVARRTVRKFVRTPQLIGLATVQSAIFLVIFRYIFGGAINAGGLPYVDFLVPGFVVTGFLWAGMSAAAGVAEDVEQGLFDRLRSLPIVGAALGFAVGFHMHGSVAAGLAALGLCVLFSFAFEWVFITIGLVAGTAQAAQGMSVLMTVLVFVSSAYVPVSSMPGWLRPVAEQQPVTPMVNAVRGLVGGPQAEALLAHTTAYYLGLSLIWAAAIVIVFGAAAALRFSRR